MNARGWIIAAVATLAIGGGSWLYFNREDSTPAPDASQSATAPVNGLGKDRLDEIAAIINKQEPKADKLKSQASVINPSLRENFLKLGTPISNISFDEDIKSEGARAEVSSTDANGIKYRVVLTYVEDPDAGNKPQWLVLYTEAK